MKGFFKMNLPNQLTTLRMFAVLVVIAIALIPWNGLAEGGSYMQNWMYACIANKDIVWVRVTLCVLFVVASFTDMLDGKIARKHNLVTTYGKFMDPIADKLLVNSMFIAVGNRRAFLTHGHIYNEAFHPNLNEGDILIHGHFHIPWLFDIDGITIASPGSISIPKNDSPNSYMIIDNDKIDIKNLDGESILNSIRREYNQKY